MSWFVRLFRRKSESTPDESLNIDKLVAEGLRSHEAAREGLRLLNRERQAVLRNQRLVEKRTNSMSGGRVRGIARSAGSSATGLSEFGTEYSLAMEQSRNTAGLNAYGQLLGIEERLAEIERAREQLSGYLHFGE